MSLIYQPSVLSIRRGSGRRHSRRLLLWLCVLAMVKVNAALPETVEGRALPSLAPMLERVTPAVVNIATEGKVQIRLNPLFNDPFFRRFFDIPDLPQEQKTQSLGSGVIVDAKRGLVITNHHVIKNADKIKVKLRDGSQLDATLVGEDPETDIAVIKIPAANLSALPVSNSDHLRVGDFVAAIGNPFGLGQTVTSGIVSALGRTGLGIEGYEDFIQTDASINPGNSGGALVNLRGELIGINTAIFSQSGGNIGIGFAIPINMVKSVMEQLVEHGEVNRGMLGVQMQDLNPELAQAFGVDRTEGAVVAEVVPGSAAESAGFKPGDIILSINGRPAEGASAVRNQVGLLRVGDQVKFEILRDGRKKILTARIGERKPAGTASLSGEPRLSGVTFGDIEKDSPLYGQVRGVQILEVEPGSPIWSGGLRAGDVITSVNRVNVVDLKSFLNVVEEQGDTQLLFRVLRGNNAAYVVIR